MPLDTTLRTIDAVIIPNWNYILVTLGIIFNGAITGFAVYIGSHIGQKTTDKWKKTSKEEIKEVGGEISPRKIEKLENPQKKDVQSKELEERILPKDELIE